MQIASFFRRIAKADLTVVSFGKTGVGKSSTLNSLYGLNWATDHAIACTKRPQRAKFKTQDSDCPYKTLRIVDLPGIGESLEAEKQYMPYYRKWVARADTLLWITQADTRAYKRDEDFLEKLAYRFKPSLHLIVALNKIDCLGVYEGGKGFDDVNREPSCDQLKLIPEKVDDIYYIFQKAIGRRIVFEKNQIVPYTSFYGWGLNSLERQILKRR